MSHLDQLEIRRGFPLLCLHQLLDLVFKLVHFSVLGVLLVENPLVLLLLLLESGDCFFEHTDLAEDFLVHLVGLSLLLLQDFDIFEVLGALCCEHLSVGLWGLDT